MIIFTFAIGLVLLPIGLAGIRQLSDLIMIRRAKNFQDMILPAVYTCLDPASLAEGKPVLLTSQAEGLIRDIFSSKMPSSLQNRLSIERIDFLEKETRQDPDHWMGVDQPLKQPVIVLRTTYIDHRSNEVPLCSSIEMLID